MTTEADVAIIQARQAANVSLINTEKEIKREYFHKDDG